MTDDEALNLLNKAIPLSTMTGDYAGARLLCQKVLDAYPGRDIDSVRYRERALGQLLKIDKTAADPNAFHKRLFSGVLEADEDT